MYKSISIGLTVLVIFVFVGCGTQRRVNAIHESEATVTINIPQTREMFRELKDNYESQDTIVVTDMEGNEVIFMETFVEEEGNEMAHETLKAAKVVARFRNVAERNGRVNIEFDITVPKNLIDSKWQVRFYPRMHILEDIEDLEPIYITGHEYRQEQLRGYELYNRFINSIITDSTRFIRIDALEVFLQRNIPEVFQFKSDSSYVSQEVFYSYYGATQREAVEHYTYKMKVRHNNRKEGRKEKMRRRYIKSPIVYDGIRLDTIVNGADGDIIYRYVQGFKTRPKLRKVDIVLSGEIYEQDRCIYSIPETDKLTFYISSLNTFVRDIVRYKSRIIERRALANTSAGITFNTGSWVIDPKLADNEREIGRVQELLVSIMDNNQFDLDSVTVNAFASPEGYIDQNRILAGKRSESVSDHFRAWIQHQRDSLSNARGFSVDEEGNIVVEKVMDISFISYNDGENWNDLDILIEKDTTLTQAERERYLLLRKESHPDRREDLMKKEGWYSYVRKELYPKLRTVKFDFHMHRKGMIKDTVHTTVLDSVYMEGVQALRDMDYERAISLLIPYEDFNTAVAYCATGRNANALRILEGLEKDAQVNYLLAVIYSRTGKFQQAVQCYVNACEQEPSYVHRGNLDPEIADLIQRYGLNRQEEEFDYDL